MDYNNLKQLIARYWEGNTSIEEDREIKLLFAEHADLPEELEKWRSWFSNLSDINNAELGKDFDIKILEHIEQEPVKVKKVFFSRFRTIAAACIVLLVISGWEIISYQSEKKEQQAVLQAKADYEHIKNMLYFTSSKINETEKEVQKNLSKMDIMNEIINLK